MFLVKKGGASRALFVFFFWGVSAEYSCSCYCLFVSLFFVCFLLVFLSVLTAVFSIVIVLFFFECGFSSL